MFCSGLILCADSKVAVSPCRSLRRAVTPATPLSSQWTSTRLVLRFPLVRRSILAAFSAIPSSRTWWSSNMPPWGTRGAVVPGEVEGDEAEDDGPILKNPKTKWLPWQHTLYSICGQFIILVAQCRNRTCVDSVNFHLFWKLKHEWKCHAVSVSSKFMAYLLNTSSVFARQKRTNTSWYPRLRVKHQQNCICTLFW